MYVFLMFCLGRHCLTSIYDENGSALKTLLSEKQMWWWSSALVDLWVIHSRIELTAPPSLLLRMDKDQM